MLSTQAIQWCIKNCAGYVYGDEAEKEFRALLDLTEILANVTEAAIELVREDGRGDPPEKYQALKAAVESFIKKE